MLECVEREIGESSDLAAGCDDAEDTALIARAIAVFEGSLIRQGNRRREKVAVSTTGQFRLARHPAATGGNSGC
jgi:hypothetical protein